VEGPGLGRGTPHRDLDFLNNPPYDVKLIARMVIWLTDPILENLTRPYFMQLAAMPPLDVTKEL